MDTMRAMPIAPAQYPPPFAPSEVDRGAGGAGGRAHRRRRCDRRRRAGGARRRRSGSASCWQAIPRWPSSWARCRSRSSTRAARSARTSSRAPSSTRAALRELLPGVSLESLTSYGPVAREAVYFLPSGSRAVRLPTPPPFHNKGNHVFSLARLARCAGRAGGGARGDAAARDRRAARCSSPTARCAACARATRARVRDGRRAPAFEPGAELHAHGDRARRRRAGACSPRPRSTTSGSQGENPQVYALGVKEMWRVPTPARPGHPHARLAAAGRARATTSSAARSSTRWATT